MLTEDEFIDLYKNGYARACSIFARTGLAPDLCDDVAQDMYLRMWENRAWKTDSYTPLTFWYLCLRHALTVILPKYKAGEQYIITNSDAFDYIKDHYPDLTDMTWQVQFESFLEQLPDALAADILAKYEATSFKDAYEFLVITGYKDTTKTSEAYTMKMSRLRDSPEIKAIMKEYFGR